MVQGIELRKLVDSSTLSQCEIAKRARTSQSSLAHQMIRGCSESYYNKIKKVIEQEENTMNTVKELQRVLACMKLMQAEGNQDDITPEIMEQLKAFDTVISAVENFEGMTLTEVVEGLEDKSIEYLMKTADETVA